MQCLAEPFAAQFAEYVRGAEVRIGAIANYINWLTRDSRPRLPS